MCAHPLEWLNSLGVLDVGFQSMGKFKSLLRERRALKVQILPVILTNVKYGRVSRSPSRAHVKSYPTRRKNSIRKYKSAVGISRRFI
jgi:hypothetical protein